MISHPEKLVKNIFLEAVKACSIEQAIGACLRARDGYLHAAGRAYATGDVRIVAAGKAADAMFHAVSAALAGVAIRAVVAGPAAQYFSAKTQHFAAGHPTPNQASFDAGRAALNLFRDATPDTLALFLISGGASSMLECPLDADVRLDDLVDFYRQLVASGAPITAINTLRKRVSAIKGGKLAVAAGPAQKLSLFVSDVPANSLDALASGPTMPDASSSEDCRRLLATVFAGSHFPTRIQALLERPQETPKPGDAAFANAASVVLLSNESLVQAAAVEAEAAGLHVTVDNTPDDWDYADAARYLCDRFAELQQRNPSACLISGGEITVQLPAEHGTGGRNSHFALECARLLHASALRATVLSAGSDGIDGNSEAAGAVADETTWSCARAAGLDPAQHLAGADASTLFASLGDAVVTGPTGNNLRDLRIFVSSGVSSADATD